MDNLGGLIKSHLFTLNGITILTVLILLQFLNYAIENLKWRQVLSELKRIPFIETQKAVYAGNAVAILTPDRLGTFIGRFSYLTEVSKTKITVSTFVGNYAQLVTTLIFALIGLIITWNSGLMFKFPKSLSINVLISIMVFVCCVSLFAYYHQRTILDLLKKWKWKHAQELIRKLEFMEHLHENRLHIVLGIAFVRYLVFVLQFFLALNLLGAEVDYTWTLGFCGILYLFATIIPSPFMGNLGTREAIGVFLVSPLGLEETVIVASLFVWLINVVLPSLIGGIILLKK